jgi:hypothetical protein
VHLVLSCSCDFGRLARSEVPLCFARVFVQFFAPAHFLRWRRVTSRPKDFSLFRSEPMPRFSSPMSVFHFVSLGLDLGGASCCFSFVRCVSVLDFRVSAHGSVLDHPLVEFICAARVRSDFSSDFSPVP